MARAWDTYGDALDDAHWQTGQALSDLVWEGKSAEAFHARAKNVRDHCHKDALLAALGVRRHPLRWRRVPSRTAVDRVASWGHSTVTPWTGRSAPTSPAGTAPSRPGPHGVA